MTTPTLDSGTIDIGVVTEESVNLDNGLFKKKLPGTSSDTSLALDIFGKSRTIIIKGVKTGTEAQRKTFVETMDTWANSNTMERKTYRSSINKTYSVRADLWSYQLMPTKVEYTLVMVEAGVL